MAAVAIAWCGAGALAGDSLDAIHVDTTTGHFVDSHGRVRIFHGANIVYKPPPYYPPHDPGFFDAKVSFSDVDAALWQSWGFSVARLYVAWPGVQPAAFQTNETYLDQVADIVAILEAAGVYSLLDSHQDVASRYYCGEGLPDWLVASDSEQHRIWTFPEPLAKNISRDASGHPLLAECLAREFGLYYLTDAVASAFGLLYENRSSSQAHFADMWRAVASRFSSRDAVLGYELLNEPAIGDFYKHPSLLVEGGKTDREYLMPMYRMLQDAIRSVDRSHAIFYEPCVFDVLEIGFDEALGPNTVFSYHNYCFDVNRRSDPKSGLVCDVADDVLIENRVATARKRRLGGTMLTEFGATSDAAAGVAEVARVGDLADQHLQSWTYWMAKWFGDYTTADQPASSESFYNVDGSLQTAKVAALSRTYAQAIAGDPVSVRYGSSTGDFSLDFVPNLQIDTAHFPTVVYVNAGMNYPDGYQVTVDPAASLSWTTEEVGVGRYLRFEFGAAAHSAQHIVIHIRRQHK